MEQKCSCCGRTLTEQKCTYCGFLNVTVLEGTDSAQTEEYCRKRAEAYRAKLAATLTEFSVDAFVYQWNETKGCLEMAGQERVRIADGADCLNRLTWSPRSFGQNSLEEVKGRTITISYKAGGEEKRFTAELKPITCPEFWRIGLLLHDDFTVSVFLGTDETHTETGPYPLQLK